MVQNAGKDNDCRQCDQGEVLDIGKSKMASVLERFKM